MPAKPRAKASTPYRHVIVGQPHAEVRLITIHRPEVHNALNVDTMFEIQSALKNAARDKQKVVILTGTPPAFSAGGDLPWLLREIDSKGAAHAARGVYRGFQGVTRVIRKLPLVVISAVNGAAAGGGMDMALACDLCFACPSSRFVQSWVKLGLVPAMGGAYFILRRAGWKGIRLVYTGEIIDGRQAHEMGLVDGLFDDDKLLPECLAVAQRIARGSHQVLAGLKTLISTTETPGLEKYLGHAVRLQGRLLGTDEFRTAAEEFIRRK